MKNEKKSPLVSVVITTRNSEETLGKLLKSVKQQSYKYKEIVVVDNDSRDKTKEIALKYTKKVYNQGPERSRQRNFGAEKAKGQYLLFLDSDMVLTEKVMEECVGEIKKGNANIGGVVIPEKSFGKGFWTKCKI